jgi:hypothetical protein
VKTFEWTYGRVGQFTSQMGDSRAVHYGDGTTLVGTEITNLGEPGMTGLGWNDGTVVKILGTTEFYFSSDSKLTSHASVWSFASVADGLVIDQRPYCVVKYDLSYWSCESSQLLLFDIQDVTVLAGTYADAIIMWTLDAQYPFADLDLADKRPELRIAPPTRQDTQSYSVTGFDIFGLNTGLIASGDIDAESGALVDLAELKDVVREGSSFATADLAGTWDVHALNVGRPPVWLGWSHFELRIDDHGNGWMVPGTYLNSSGETDAASTVTMTVAENGIVSMIFPAVDADNCNVHGVLSPNKRLVVMTMDDEGGCGLSILQKRTGVVFSADDLAGTWSMNAVGIGASPDSSWQGWTYGDMTIDAKGAFLEVPGSSRDSSGYSPGVGSGTMTLTSGGLLGVEGRPLMHGTLSDNTDLAVFTHTDPEHPSDYGLSICQRRSSIPLTRSDLSGVWRLHGLSTEGGTWANWVYGTWTVHADGTSNGLLYKSDGTTSPLGGTVTVASYGVFRIDPFEYTHGIMGSDRDVIVLVTTDSVGEQQMLIGTRTGTVP